jgi:hypothetical protein
MHVSRAELDPTVIGEYEGRSIDAAGIRIAFESMPAHFPVDEHDRTMAVLARNMELVAG